MTGKILIKKISANPSLLKHLTAEKFKKASYRSTPRSESTGLMYSAQTKNKILVSPFFHPKSPGITIVGISNAVRMLQKCGGDFSDSASTPAPRRSERRRNSLRSSHCVIPACQVRLKSLLIFSVTVCQSADGASILFHSPVWL